MQRTERTCWHYRRTVSSYHPWLKIAAPYNCGKWIAEQEANRYRQLHSSDFLLHPTLLFFSVARSGYLAIPTGGLCPALFGHARKYNKNG
jgi:hypothetical protein